MYHCFDPVFVYGIKEPGDNMIIDPDVLAKYEIDFFADSIIRDYACNLIYGVVLSFEDFVAQKTIDHVIDFAEKFSLPKPTHYLAIMGDFELCHESYSPGGESYSDESE